MARLPSPRKPGASADNIHIISGLVWEEEVYTVRRDFRRGPPMRAMWVRANDGRDWRIIMDARDVRVRAGHRIQAVVLGGDEKGYVLRLRNLATGRDRVDVTILRWLADAPGYRAMTLGFKMTAGLFLLAFVLTGLERVTGLALGGRAVGWSALALPLPVAFLTAVILHRFARAQQRWLLEQCTRLPPPPEDVPEDSPETTWP